MTDPRPSAPSRDEKRQMKSAARLYAVQALFQMEASGQSADKVRVEFETYRFGEEVAAGERHPGREGGEPVAASGALEVENGLARGVVILKRGAGSVPQWRFRGAGGA